MISKTKIRESNIELLRIVAMILIVVGHITQHGIEAQLSDTILYEPGTFFNHFMFYKRLVLIDIFRILGQIGNVIFILITGYFLAEKKKINLFKSLSKLLPQVLFATIVLIISSFIYYKLGHPSFRGLVDFEIFYTEWWFVGYYIIIIIIGYLFLNKFLGKLNKKEYITFMLALFAIVSLKHSGDAVSQISSNIRSIMTGILIYSFGGYIKKYNPFKNIKSLVLIVLIIITFAAIGLSYHNYNITNINNAFYNGEEFFSQELLILKRYSIESLVIGTCFFELFKRIKIKNNKIINYIAASTFMIYLIHETNFMWQILFETDWISLYYYNMPKFFLYFFGWVLGIFVIGFIAYVIYNYLMKFLQSKTFKKLIYKKGTI